MNIASSSVKHPCVVIADDHLEMFKALCRLVAERFDTVIHAADEPSLRRTLASVAPDLLIVDLSLPVTAPGGILQTIRLHGKPVAKIIALSVHDEPEVRDQTLAAGIDGFVLKRSAVDDLIPAINAVFEEERCC